MQLSPTSVITKGKLGGMAFMYNPSSYTDSGGVNWNEMQSAGMSYPNLVYGGGRTRQLTFTIYLNDKVQTGITKRFIDNLEKFLPPARTKGYQFISAKTIQFAFGSFVKDCKLADINKEILAFSPQLVPIEANVTVVLNVIQ
jgi:Contractile injection system tube protein